jgi:hypothetical protein
VVVELIFEMLVDVMFVMRDFKMHVFVNACVCNVAVICYLCYV